MEDFEDYEEIISRKEGHMLKNWRISFSESWESITEKLKKHIDTIGNITFMCDETRSKQRGE